LGSAHDAGHDEAPPHRLDEYRSPERRGTRRAFLSRRRRRCHGL